MMQEEKTIASLVMEYFRAHPNENIQHGPVVDWVEVQYVALYGKKPRDTWRTIRQLFQEGKLIKEKKGVYRYEPDYTKEVHLFDFPEQIKEAIFKRDNYRCVVCGRGRAEGVEICADHIKPKDRGGDNSLSNGQTLCTQHNLMKSNYSQTEAGKRLFIKLYEQAKALNDQKMISFCEAVFDVYDAHDIDRHIERPDRTSFNS